MNCLCLFCFFFFSSRRRHTRFDCDWSSDVCSSDLHHCFWDLQRTSDQELKKRSRGEVAYAQLYRQSGQYRGQVVTVRGTARRAYRVQASKNHLGIEEYFVFWVSPFESADTPLVVYAT